MRYAIRLLTLLAATTGALWLTGAPASAVTLTTPTLPAPLPPVQLPVSASVSGGTDGTPINVTVTAPESTTIGVEVAGVTKPPPLPGISTTPTPVPPLTVVIAPPTPAALTAPVSPASPSRGVSPGPPVAVTAPEARSPSPSLRFPTASVRAVAAPTQEAPVAHVSAAMRARATDALLSRLSTIAARVLLWAALALIAFALQMLVSSALAQRRRMPAGVS